LTGLSVGNITGMSTAGMFSRSSSVLCGAYDYSGTCKFCPTSARLCIFVVHVNPAPLFSILIHSGPLAKRLQRLFSVLLRRAEIRQLAIFVQLLTHTDHKWHQLYDQPRPVNAG